jgi:hypothetical protein
MNSSYHIATCDEIGFICEHWNQRAVKAMDAHIHQRSRKSLNKRLPESWWQQEKSADSGIHATRDHDNVRSVLWNTKKLHMAIQNKRCGMLRSSVLVVLLHDNMQLLALEHCWGISLLPDATSASILVVTTLRSSLNMYVLVFLVYHKCCFCHCLFC